jgi:hypothetical protein
VSRSLRVLAGLFCVSRPLYRSLYSGSRSLLTDLVRQAGIVVQYKIGEGSFGKCVKVLNRKNRQVRYYSVKRDLL